jgi:hypothetical protein
MFGIRRAPKGQRPETPLQLIHEAEHELVALTWKGSPAGIVKVKILSDVETQALGNFSLIETESFTWSKARVKTSWSEILAYAQKNSAICRAALISPTYDEIFAAIGKSAFNDQVKAQVGDINRLLEDMPLGPARQELEEIRDSLIFSWEVILPDDFMAGVVTAALQTARTDIKKITADMLLSAAILAERGGKAPHEYVHGVFSDYNRRDIDNRAWILYDEHMEELREEAKARRV